MISLLWKSLKISTTVLMYSMLDLNCRWALPEPMAQAGFYYQPSSTGDDRAMCFTCNVCLVCWEPTDEPWFAHAIFCALMLVQCFVVCVEAGD